jgi:hypothetical protein
MIQIESLVKLLIKNELIIIEIMFELMKKLVKLNLMISNRTIVS